MTYALKIVLLSSVYIIQNREKKKKPQSIIF